MDEQAHTYRIYDTLVTSPFKLRDLDEVDPGEGRARFCVVLGPVADRLPGSIATPYPGIWTAPDAVLLYHPAIGRALVHRSGIITIEYFVPVDHWFAAAFFTGPILGAMLYFVDQMPLHASAAARDGLAVAIAGKSGAGKSTFAAGLTAFGWNPIADDTTIVKWGDEDFIGIGPGPRRFRLLPDACSAFDFGKGTAADPREMDKTIVPGLTSWVDRPVALKALIALETPPDGQTIALARLGAPAAADVLRQNVHWPFFSALSRNAPTIRQRCEDLAARLPVYRLTRPKRFDQFSSLEAILRDLISGPA